MSQYYTMDPRISDNTTAIINTLIGAAGQATSSYFQSQNQNTGNPAPTYNIIGGMPAATGNPQGQQYVVHHQSDTKSKDDKIMGMPSTVGIIVIVAVIAALGFAAFYFTQNKS